MGKFPFLFFVRTAPGVQLWFWPHSCSFPDRTGLKEWLIRGLLLTQAGRREGYGTWGEPAAAEAKVTLQQHGVHHVFSWGSCPWIMGPWQCQAAQAPWRGGMDRDLCLHTGFLVAAAAVLEFHARLWCPC